MSSYSKRQRILTLDLLRGYFLAVIAVDHIAFFPNLFELFTGRGVLWASAAEGFFIISGILVGYIYGPRLAQNARQATKKMWARAAQLYVLSVGFTWLFYVWGSQIGPNTAKPGLISGMTVTEFLYKTITVQYAYGWTDFLQYYAVFMFVAPLAVYACIRGKGWLVVVSSVAVWLLRGDNFTLGIQLMFMLGIVVGYYLPSIEQRFKSLPMAKKKLITYSTVGLAITTVVLSALTVRVSSVFMRKYEAGNTDYPDVVVQIMQQLHQFHNLTRPLVDKFTMAPLRVVMALLWFAALYMIVRRYEQQIDRFTRGFFTTLGQNSLFVYCTQGVLVFAILAMFPGKFDFITSSLVSAAVLLLVYFITVYHKPIVNRCKKLVGLQVKA